MTKSTQQLKDSYEQQMSILKQTAESLQAAHQKAVQTACNSFLIKIIELHWREAYPEVPSPCLNEELTNKLIDEFKLTLGERFSLILSNSEDFQKKLLKAFYRNLQKTEKLEFNEVPHSNEFVAHGKDIAYMLYPVPGYDEGDYLYNIKKYINFEGAGVLVENIGGRASPPYTLYNANMICQNDYNKILAREAASAERS